MYFNNHTFINKDTFITKLLRGAVLVMALLSTFSYVRAQEVYLEDDDSPWIPCPWTPSPCVRRPFRGISP